MVSTTTTAMMVASVPVSARCTGASHLKQLGEYGCERSATCITLVGGSTSSFTTSAVKNGDRGGDGERSVQPTTMTEVGGDGGYACNSAVEREMSDPPATPARQAHKEEGPILSLKRWRACRAWRLCLFTFPWLPQKASRPPVLGIHPPRPHAPRAITPSR